jgi:predicted metal-dependent hydrolase
MYGHAEDDMDAHLRAGIAIYNAGAYHAAHDAWEDHWLDLESGTDDEQFLHGLIQFTAAVVHAKRRNWSGATGLASSACEYLAGLPESYRDVDVGRVREYLDRLADDPERIERRRPLTLQYADDRLDLVDLDFPETCIAAEVLAEEHDYDTALVEQAIEYASADGPESGTPFVALLFDFVREPENRAIVLQRLEEHVSRRASKESDVSGLFDDA